MTNFIEELQEMREIREEIIMPGDHRLFEKVPFEFYGDGEFRGITYQKRSLGM